MSTKPITRPTHRAAVTHQRHIAAMRRAAANPPTPTWHTWLCDRCGNLFKSLHIIVHCQPCIAYYARHGISNMANPADTSGA